METPGVVSVAIAPRKCLGHANGSSYDINAAIKDRLNDRRSFEHDRTGLIDLEAYREAIAIIQDETASRDAKYYAGRDIRGLPVMPPRLQGGGKYYAVTHYRAGNAFGGMVRGSAQMTLNRDCSVHTLISVE